jgi:hypothetical protein
MIDSDNARIARLLQASAALFSNGHTRGDAVLTAFELERQVIQKLESEQRSQETQ